MRPEASTTLPQKTLSQVELFHLTRDGGLSDRAEKAHRYLPVVPAIRATLMRATPTFAEETFAFGSKRIICALEDDGLG
jgi:hypothetical protein